MGFGLCSSGLNKAAKGPMGLGVQRFFKPSVDALNALKQRSMLQAYGNLRRLLQFKFNSPKLESHLEP